MSEDHLIRHCSPTLAGIKTGSMFCCTYSTEAELRESIRQLNRRLVPKGLRLLPLRLSGQKALIYLYRPGALGRDLSDETACRLLKEKGYCTDSQEGCIVELVRRLRQHPEFPHEIGLFLGYPPEDVKGFIENNACQCKCSGCWKVYGDAVSAQKRFDQYKKCSQVYRSCWARGRSLEQLTVQK